MQPYVDARIFMGSVLEARKGKTIFNNSYGMADLEWSIPNSPTTRFNIASMTKQFTAAAILLLEDRGKLKTSDLVKKYLPDAPASWDNITIYHGICFKESWHRAMKASFKRIFSNLWGCTTLECSRM
jgi:CubicO group peptidase (beta-lactamase class C family)